VTEASRAGEKARAKKDAGTGRLQVRLVRSGICAPKDQKATLRGLGFRRLGQTVVHQDSLAVRGMIHKVRHLVDVTKN
jgi:large subunit ribosomal protein L30